MYDHIIKGGDTEADARVLLPDFGSLDENGAWHWRGDCVISDLKIITEEAVYDASNPPVFVSPQVSLEGFWLAIALPEVSDALLALPNDACRIITNRTAAEAGENFFVFVSSVVETSILTGARVAPVFAGSHYPFGV